MLLELITEEDPAGSDTESARSARKNDRRNIDFMAATLEISGKDVCCSN
jgi:hypothetical protein